MQTCGKVWSWRELRLMALRILGLQRHQLPNAAKAALNLDLNESNQSIANPPFYMEGE